jgi:hypothetical protein
VRAALGEMLPPDEAAPDVTMLRHVRLTSEQARALAAGLEQLINGEQEEPESGRPYGILVSLYRADIPALPDDQPR